MKRKFVGKELGLALKGVENKKQEREWLEYQLQYCDLMLKTGLEMNYKKNIRDFKQQKNEHEKDLYLAKNVITILQTQIREGVEERVEKSDEEIEQEAHAKQKKSYEKNEKTGKEIKQEDN